MRAPIKTINSYLELIYEDFEGDIPSGLVDYLDRIRKAGSRLDDVVEGLLSLSKIVNMEYSPRKVNINNIVSQITSQLRNKFPNMNVGMDVEPLIEAKGDEDLIYLLYQKLLDNAWKFCSNKPEPHIVVGVIKKTNQETVYYVGDNGIGFDMKRANKLFIPFQHQHSGNQLEGIGIGLATAYRIVTRHGGKIWAESVIGSGARFNFTLGGQ